MLEAFRPGPQTIADDWALEIRLPAQKTAVEPALMDFNLPNQPPIHIGDETIPLDKLLYKETKSPIPNGDKREGVLAFYVNGKKATDLEKVGTKFVLSCHDIAGNLIKDEAVWNGTGGGFRHSPGLE